MATASQEMAELLREVQKLQKELQPVRTAIAALQKREAESPNPAAAGASLNKVATRLETVRLKYEPLLLRLRELMADEVPAYVQQTQLLAMSDDLFDAKAGGDATHTPAQSSHRSTAGEASTSAPQPRSDDPARLLLEVCPPSTPHLLQPENVRFTRQQLRVRADMVEYLIATDRLDIADHVARAYGLPLQWFPRLLAQHQERVYGGAVAAAAVSGTSAAGLRNTASTPNASPLVTPAVRPRAAGMPPKSPIQLPSAAAGGVSPSTLPSTPARAPLHDGRSPSLGVSNAKAVSALEGGSEAAAEPLMPDLVARVVSTAMYLKDEYLDRMVLERMLEQQLGLTAGPGGCAEEASLDSPQAQYKTCVLSRIASIPRHHLHTQSGDPAFDNVMMNVIEDLLVYGLQRWAEDDTSVLESGAEAQRGAESPEAAAAETKKRKAELTRSLTTDTFLTPDEMLLADKVWNEEILFLKRPTRFYCVETGLSTEEAGGLSITAPRARATGEVVSQLVAETQGTLEGTTGIYIT